ncbi:MAG: protein kinase [Planctomycetes bacterium RBG_16_64_10]|nr:MAG: protein kinase [Planctomycetes bacterium RBG_16_64_10]
MLSTTLLRSTRTIALDGHEHRRCPDELYEQYQSLIDQQRFSRTEYLRLTRQLGAGGQGVVFLTERRGSDHFTLPMALKIFSPERYEDGRSYDESMARIAQVASDVAQIQQHNLLDVHNFGEVNRIRFMEMEWIDGFDLLHLLTDDMLNRVAQNVSQRRFQYINDVVVTAGPVHPRLKPGVAVAVTRECLNALAALHRRGIVHGDVKPSNIMLQRTGNTKIVDIGSAIDLKDPPPVRTCTPTYAAPEVLERGECTPRSDLASLGYVLIEMLAGRPLFAGMGSVGELLEAKRMLPQRLSQILPSEVVCNGLLMNFCRGLTAPDPMRRFPSAEDAELLKEGAADFHRQLVKVGLDSEYKNEIRIWLESLN